MGAKHPKSLVYRYFYMPDYMFKKFKRIFEKYIYFEGLIKILIIVKVKAWREKAVNKRMKKMHSYTMYTFFMLLKYMECSFKELNMLIVINKMNAKKRIF